MIDGIKAVQEEDSSGVQSKNLAQLCAEALEYYNEQVIRSGPF
jgi:hypothetical protein